MARRVLPAEARRKIVQQENGAASHAQPMVNPHAWALAELERRLADGAFFTSLPRLGEPETNRVRLVKINGAEFVVKDTGGHELQGHNFRALRGAFLRHQLAVRRGEIKPQNYVLRSIKVFGLLRGRYLVMRRVEGKHIPVYFTGHGPDAELKGAYDEMTHNVNLVEGLFYTPQYIDTIYSVLRRKGHKTFIFYLPYDHA